MQITLVDLASSVESLGKLGVVGRPVGRRLLEQQLCNLDTSLLRVFGSQPVQEGQSKDCKQVFFFLQRPCTTYLQQHLLSELLYAASKLLDCGAFAVVFLPCNRTHLLVL